jgi:Electron transfer DM13
MAMHRGRLVVVGGVVVPFVAAALLWFEPWQLFVRTTVNEPAPRAPSILSSGEFRSLEHETSGTARILELANGRRFVRLDDLRTSSGPDLVVLLSETPAAQESWGAYDDGRTALLGSLKGNVGSQNYAIPSNVDPSRFRSVVIWCRRFTVGFGAAPINA